MTIESVSFPPDLSSWDGSTDSHPFYLELFGETQPVLDATYAEICAPNAREVDETSRASRLYEYWWTIGRPIPREKDGALPTKDSLPEQLWARLHHRDAWVYVYFPLGAGWRVKELAATVKFMRPVPHEREFLERASEDWKIIGPFVEGASSIAMRASPVGAAAGLAARKTVEALNSLAHLKIGAVPQVKGFEWTATKVTTRGGPDGGALQGVAWMLPRSLLIELGGRITGSLAVSLIPDHRQERDKVWKEPLPPAVTPGTILAQALVHTTDDKILWAPAEDEFIKLVVSPVLPG